MKNLHDLLKRTAKCAISLGVHTASGLGTMLTRLMGRTPQGSCVIVYYHSVPADQRTQFAKQMDYLVRYTTPIAVNRPAELTSGICYTAVTFDDAFENFYHCALPEMMQRRIPGTIFVISDAIGKSFGPPGSLERVMSLEQILSLPDLMTIGSHTVSHPFLPSVDLNKAAREIALSRTTLEDMLNRKVLLFSFPFGGFDEEHVDFCRQAGYTKIFSTLPRCASLNPNEFLTGRVRVDPTDWPIEFKLKVAGAYRWLPWAFKLKRKVTRNSFLRKLTGSRSLFSGSPPPQSMISTLD
jgi:peptidoglycan/xylan/chitin deacetylase (PgdA/CDA1 family)